MLHPSWTNSGRDSHSRMALANDPKLPGALPAENSTNGFIELCHTTEMISCRCIPRQAPHDPSGLYTQLQQAFDSDQKKHVFRDSPDNFRAAAVLFAQNNPGFRACAERPTPALPWTATFEHEPYMTQSAEDLLERFSAEHRGGVKNFAFRSEMYCDCIAAAIHFETSSPGFKIDLIKVDAIWHATIREVQPSC